MNERSLSQWLDYIETLHPAAIDMGLARVTRVAEALGFAPPDHAPAPVSVIVAGTNGKGSTSVFTEALLLERGQRVGTTLSPHVHEFNERVRIDGVAADDALLCDAFAEVDAARGSVALTYFEFAALVALCCFRRAAVDVAILEVGLGGRLDAFNLVGANLAVVTSIGLDHQAFLGDDLEQIGREKAAVMRAGRSAVVGSDVTASVLQHAQAEGCPVRQLGRDFCVRLEPGSWHFEAPQEGLRFENLPWGPLAPENCALGIAAAARLGPVDEAMVRAALARATLPGRCEIWRLGTMT
ncbi:MAG: Mur ligase family protein [Pseudomonadales bacterium]